ncbi:putative ABC transport system permease protein [Nitrosomonas marina]|uniref:Putative ABC transport system permease protein n=1 Tax=Nitrosomonas marina TaxID=917 RepID=A0A1I0F0V2_9PROT|nr:ABC transporter permease [Nitrosomonas marina]SET50632.1 putative ABC transport system permease protein [Nitrosomonas marina]
MNESVQVIPLLNLALVSIPVLLVIGILWRWSLSPGHAAYALGRMLVQLLLIGYCLMYIFEAENSLVVIAVLAVMVTVASWIALGTIKTRRTVLYKQALISILIGGGLVLVVVTQGVLQLQPWYLPQYMIPLAGMVFANSMNAVSLAAERMNAELERQMSFDQARNIAMRAALIPTINAMLAVGLVSLPGMMTGQILSGISPLIAARYQIMVMCMIFAGGGLSTAMFLEMSRKRFMECKNF